MTKILFIEDNADDVELMLHELRKADVYCQSRRIRKKRDFLFEVNEFRPHIVLADYSLPMFTGMEAFRILKGEGIKIPFILIARALSEQLALDCVKEGVDDFILKSNFTRLPVAVNNAILRKNGENEKEKMEREIKRSHRDLQKLTERLQTMREEERLKIGRDLHDELGQVLTGLKIDISMLWKKISTGTTSEPVKIDSEFSGIIGLVDQVMQSVRRIYSGLRPEILDELDLVEAIRWQCQEFETRNKIECQTILNVESLDVDNNASITLYRIVQEALTNVVRHAEATRVEVHLSRSGETFLLSIKDNGKGISLDRQLQSGALGIIGLRERVRSLNGKFVLTGKPGKGTMILVTVPAKQTYTVEQD